MGRQSGQPPGGVGEHIHRIGHDHQDALEIPAGELGNNAFQNRYVLANQVQAGLAGLLVGSGGDDDHGAVGHVVVVSGVDAHGGSVGQTVAQVHGLAFRLLPVGVDEHQLGENALLHQTESDRGSHKTAADHRGLSYVDHSINAPFQLAVVLPVFRSAIRYYYPTKLVGK